MADCEMEEEKAKESSTEDSSDEEGKDDQFEVEKILQSAKDEQGLPIYKVRWKNYGPNDDTWEPISNLQNCLQLVEDFNKQRSEQFKARKRPKVKHGSWEFAAEPPPLRDGDFWKKADENRLEVDDTPLCEVVKARSQQRHTLNEKLIEASVWNGDLFAVESETSEEDECERKTEKKRKISKSPNKRLSLDFNKPAAATSDRRKSDLECSINPDSPMQVKIKIKQPDHSSLPFAETAIREKSVGKEKGKEKKDKAKKIKKTFERNVSCPSTESKPAAEEPKKKVKPKKVFDCPILFAPDMPSTSAPKKIVKNVDAHKKVAEAGKKSSEAAKGPKPSSSAISTTTKNLFKSSAASKQRELQRKSPDNVIDIEVSGGIANFNREAASPNVDAEKIELLTKTYNELYGAVENTEAERKLEKLQKLYRMLAKNLLRAKSYVYPVTYIPTDEELVFRKKHLTMLIRENDPEGFEEMLDTFRLSELSVDDLSNGCSALMMCSSLSCRPSDHPMCQIIEMLVEAGADINLKSNEETALIIAASRGHICQVNKLLNLGAKVDIVNKLNESALFLVIRKCPEERALATLKALLSFGADHTIENDNRFTAYEIATHKKKATLIKAFEEHINALENSFKHHVTEILSGSAQVSSEMLNLRCLEVKTAGNWQINFNVKELRLPEGYGVCLFLALARFGETGVSFLSGKDIPVGKVTLNGEEMTSICEDSMDVLWLEPLIHGVNTLVIHMTEATGNCEKLAVKSNIVEIDDVQCSINVDENGPA